MGVSEGEKKEKGVKSLFKKIMATDFQNLGREKDNQIHEVHKTSNRLNLNKSIPRIIIPKSSKSKMKF